MDRVKIITSGNGIVIEQPVIKPCPPVNPDGWTEKTIRPSVNPDCPVLYVVDRYFALDYWG